MPSSTPANTKTLTKNTAKKPTKTPFTRSNNQYNIFKHEDGEPLKFQISKRLDRPQLTALIEVCMNIKALNSCEIGWGW